jgi:hypothetical protein
VGERIEREGKKTHKILRQRVQKLLDLVRILVLKLLPRPDDALVEPERLAVNQVTLDLDQLVRLTGLLGRFDEVGLGKVRVDDFSGLGEVLFEALLGPLRFGEEESGRAGRRESVRGHEREERKKTNGDSVLDLVGEVLDRATRVTLLRRVLRARVRFGDVRKDDLDVSLGAERAGLEERLLVVDATLVHVLTSSDVVESVGDAVNRVEEGIAEDVCAGES